MESAERQDSTAVMIGLMVVNLVLVCAAVGALIFGFVMLAMAPQVGVRPGVQSYVEVPEDGPATNCGGSALRVAVRGPRVAADTVQHAQQAARACTWSAQKNAARGAFLILLALGMLFVALRIKLRLEGENVQFIIG
jgi:hypothetical protein